MSIYNIVKVIFQNTINIDFHITRTIIKDPMQLGIPILGSVVDVIDAFLYD